jgi:CRISPR/Cas system-associated endonuclease/helicase Cas3
MANTRRKAANIFHSLIDKFPNALYLWSGIRKKDRTNILSQIREKDKSNDSFLLVSTQVVEAGVDISFSQIFREKAPLDSIIQVMGRLNREAEDDKATLVVFEYPDKNHKPYSQLELEESEERLGQIRNSIDLYSLLPDYYQSISEKNNLYKEYTKELDDCIAKLDFDGIWEFINNHVFLEEDRDTVLIPESEHWNKIKEILVKKDLRLTKAEFRMFSNISASLPKTIYELGIQDFFDEDGIERNILLPKKEYLTEVYDSVLGTDKWLIQKS